MLVNSFKTLLPKASGEDRSFFVRFIVGQVMGRLFTLVLPRLTPTGKALLNSAYLSWHSLQSDRVCLSLSACDRDCHASVLKLDRYVSLFSLWVPFIIEAFANCHKVL